MNELCCNTTILLTGGKYKQRQQHQHPSLALRVAKYFSRYFCRARSFCASEPVRTGRDVSMGSVPLLSSDHPRSTTSGPTCSGWAAWFVGACSPYYALVRWGNAAACPLRAFSATVAGGLACVLHPAFGDFRHFRRCQEHERSDGASCDQGVFTYPQLGGHWMNTLRVERPPSRLHLCGLSAPWKPSEASQSQLEPEEREPHNPLGQSFTAKVDCTKSAKQSTQNAHTNNTQKARSESGAPTKGPSFNCHQSSKNLL